MPSEEDSTLSDLRNALADISAIRIQVARDTQFRAFGPATIAASGVLALLVAATQSHFGHHNVNFSAFIHVWVTTALVTIALTATEMFSRARKVHSEFANEMIYAAVEQFLPTIVVSVLLTVVLDRVATRDLWMLPGLWQLLFSLGVFASCRFLPRQMMWVGIWYLVCGFASLILESGTTTFSPWIMGIPFGIGQLLVAAVLQFCTERTGEDA
jgi:hypothetical protein